MHLFTRFWFGAVLTFAVTSIATAAPLNSETEDAQKSPPSNVSIAPLAVLVSTSIPARMLPFRELAQALVRRGWQVEVLAYEWVFQEAKLRHFTDLQHVKGINMRRVQANSSRVHQRLLELNKLVSTDAGPASYLPLYADWIKLHAVDMALETDVFLENLPSSLKHNTIVVADLDQVGASFAAMKHNVTGVMLVPNLFSGMDRHDCRGNSLFDSIVQVNGVASPMTAAEMLVNGLKSAALVALDAFLLTHAREFETAAALGFPKGHPVYHYSPCKKPLMPVIAAGVPGLGAPLAPLQPWITLTGPLMESDTLAPMTAELKTWLDARNTNNGRGVFYICYGTTVIMNPSRVIRVVSAIQTLLSNLPNIDVLWSLPAAYQLHLPTDQSWTSLLTSRVRMEIFTAQKAVLQHAAVRAFVTQCGSNSCLEGLFFGKAIVGMGFPQMDQEYNAQRVHEFGAGIALPWSSEPTSAQIAQAFETVLTSQQIQRKARDAAHLMRSAGGAERAVDVLEDIRAIGWQHLVPKVYDGPWSVKYNLPVKLLWIIFVDAPVVLIYYAIWRRSRMIALGVLTLIIACIFS